MVALWKKNKILFVFIIALIILFPNALSKESVSYTHLLCTAIGIDKNVDEYTLSLQVIVPTQSNGFNTSYKIIKTEANSINEAVDKIEYHTGKKIGFSQCEIIIFNEESARENILLPIDYFVRTHNVNNNCMLACTDSEANKILEINSSLSGGYSFDMNRLLEYNQKNLLSERTNIEQAYRTFLSPNKAFAVSLLSAVEDDSKGIKGDNPSNSNSGSSGSESSGESSGSSGGSGGEGKKKVLSNDKNIALFKGGKYIGFVNDDEVNGIEYLLQKANSLWVNVKNFTDDCYTNANIDLYVKGKTCTFNYDIVDGRLKIKCNTTVHLQMRDINQQEDFQKFLAVSVDYFTPKLLEKIKVQETERIQNSINKLSELNIDYMNVYQQFDRWNSTKFQNYLNSLPSKDDYIKYTDFEINMEFITR